MEAPLLDTALADEDSAPFRSLGELKSIFCLETVKVRKIAGPAAITFGINGVCSVFVGHVGDPELDAVSLSLNIVGTFSFGFTFGMGSALETLCGQAYGAGQVHMLGIYMQRSWIVLLVSCFFILPIYIFAAPILKFFGQVDQIADLAGTFTLQTIPQVFSLAINFPCQKFLQAQSKVNVLAWIGFSALILHVSMLCLDINGLQIMFFLGVNVAIRTGANVVVAGVAIGAGQAMMAYINLGNDSLYKLGLLLHFWAPSWICSWSCCQFGLDGD
ncbi:hypothetical protein FEM48_Zijuj03G0161800 [Ziziphus jujuba var. spinosa]|uniref:Uncharacterized protein n=1 Tax=Ziziphus jujuba var. spinosa TaxID=714518 RepID=A0A978VRB0_ZIZJJ|nr:hypothetical protein FEM48_Zijuj03G0161800 [Ziziphus jujuba var. spinosa]